MKQERSQNSAVHRFSTNLHCVCAILIVGVAGMSVQGCEPENDDPSAGIELWQDAQGFPVRSAITPGIPGGDFRVRVYDSTDELVIDEMLKYPKGGFTVADILGLLPAEALTTIPDALSRTTEALAGQLPPEQVERVTRTLTDLLPPEERAKVLRNLETGESK